VALIELMSAKDDRTQLLTWATWTEGVSTWLPKVDMLVFNKSVGADKFETVLVPWDRAYELCEKYMKPVQEDAIRFSVETFPGEEEWSKLRAIGEAIPRA
jgi:hypothetical protein